MKRSDLPEEYFCCEDFRDVIHALEDQAVPRMEEEHLMWLWQRGLVVPLSDAYLEAVSLQQCDGICHMIGRMTVTEARNPAAWPRTASAAVTPSTQPCTKEGLSWYI